MLEVAFSRRMCCSRVARVSTKPRWPAASTVCPARRPGIWRTNFSREATTPANGDRKSTRLNSSHSSISYAVFCSKKKTHAVPDTASNEVLIPPALPDPVHAVSLAVVRLQPALVPLGHPTKLLLLLAACPPAHLVR